MDTDRFNLTVSNNQFGDNTNISFVFSEGVRHSDTTTRHITRRQHSLPRRSSTRTSRYYTRSQYRTLPSVNLSDYLWTLINDKSRILSLKGVGPVTANALKWALDLNLIDVSNWNSFQLSTISVIKTYNRNYGRNAHYNVLVKRIHDLAIRDGYNI